jgi:PAS domain S-box-containing protein
MQGEDKTKEQLLDELNQLRQRITQVEKSETERKRAEGALRESEERWRSLLQNIPDIIFTVARDDTILAANRAVLGATVEETMGKNIYDNLAPEHGERVRKSLERVFQTGKPDTYEIIGVGPHGLNTAWYETTVVPNERDRQIVGVTLISTDITARKRAEEELRERGESFRRLVEDAQDIIYAIVSPPSVDSSTSTQRLRTLPAIPRKNTTLIPIWVSNSYIPTTGTYSKLWKKGI